MEGHRYTESYHAGTSPKKKWHDEQVQEKPTVGRAIDHPFLAKESAEEREIGAVLQPGSHRLAPQPIRFDLGDSSVKIDDPHLRA